MSTNGAFASYQEVIDLHTESDKVSVIGIHTPTNFVPHKMFGGFFKQFKKFKYNGCSVKLVPAARLPADPLQVSYEAGETTIDPRDMLNPLMFHGCHGNDLGMILNKLYSINTVSGSDGIYLDNGVDMWQATQFDADGPLLESLYYKALTDNTWKKAHPQRGFRKAGLRPLVYQLATNVQFDGAHAWQSGGDYGEFFSESGMPIPSTDSNTGDVWDITSSVRDNMRVFTPKLTSLGWMDTYNVLTTGKFKQVDVSDAADADEANAMINEGLFDVLKSQESMATLPRIYMGVILLPPAYKTEQYFRMIVTHHFSFKQFRGISFSNDIMDTPAYSNWNDVDNASEDSSDPIDPDTPGGGGDSPTPDPEPEPEPEPESTFVLKDNYSRGTQVTGVGTVDRYSTLEYDNQDYEVEVSFSNQVDLDNNNLLTSKTYAINQNDSDGGDIKIGVFLFSSNEISQSFAFAGGYRFSSLLYIDGKFYGYKISASSWLELTAEDVGLTVTVSPSNTAISNQLGSNTAFEDVSVVLPNA